MLFDKQKYYNYTKYLENVIMWVYILLIGTPILIGIMNGNIIVAIIGGLIGWAIASIYTITTRIKAEKMKLEIDFYIKYIKNKEQE